MSSRTDQLALRAVIALVVLAALLVLLRSLVGQLPDFAALFPPLPRKEPATAWTAPVRKPDEVRESGGAGGVHGEPVEPVRNFFQRELIVLPDPPLRRMSVTVSREKWSPVVVVPEGKLASVTFSVGRLRIERNGADIGVFYRKSSLQAYQSGGELHFVKVDPFAMLDRKPRKLCFDAETHSLRFLSLEKKSEDVVVGFSP